MTVTTAVEQPVREVPAGTLVIYTGQDGTFAYTGPADGPWGQIAISFSREHHGLRCAPDEVAPADIAIPTHDARVTVVKRERGMYPTHKGPWRLTVAGQDRDFYRTKRDATAAGLRAVAILDWHAGVEAAPESGR
jgi:hypothetical protein